jgi:hypothetical protein
MGSQELFLARLGENLDSPHLSLPSTSDHRHEHIAFAPVIFFISSTIQPHKCSHFPVFRVEDTEIHILLFHFLFMKQIGIPHILGDDAGHLGCLFAPGYLHIISIIPYLPPLEVATPVVCSIFKGHTAIATADLRK